MSDKRFVILGLPASGKTTFLAAFWHLMDSAEVECALTLDTVEGDLSYLNMIAEAWRTFKKVPRTSQVGDMDVAINVRSTVNSEKAKLIFPDLGGETFDTQVETRRCKQDFVDGFSDDDGIMLFVSANTKEDYLSVVELNDRLPPDEGTDLAEVAQDEKNEAEKSSDLVEWAPKMLPEQVRIVQILTDLLRQPFFWRRRRLAFIISAWDLVEPSDRLPMDWLETNLPLVHQFLMSNKQAFETKIFGVSAQGFDLADEKAVNNASVDDPSKRINIVAEDSSGCDLSAPIVWLMREI